MRTIIIQIRPATEAETNYIRFRLKVVGMMWQDIHRVRSDFWVAEDGGEVVGFARLEWGAEGALLGSLYVEPEYRNGGLGRVLVQRLEAEVYKRGRKQMMLFSTDAGEFFTRLGYVETPVTQTVEMMSDTPQVGWYLRHPDLLAEEISYSKML